MIKNKWNAIVEKRPYIPGLLIILFIFIIYLPALDIYLMRDDFEWLDESYSAWQDPSILFQLINNFFRPMVKLSYLLNYTLFGTSAPFYSLITILIHLVNVFLLSLFLYRVTGKNHIAVLTALLFGASSLYSEITLWAAARPDSILLMFIMGILLRFTSINADEKEKRPWLRHVTILLLALCTAGTKETWVLLPFFVFTFLWIVKQIPLKTTLKKTSLLFLLLVLYLFYFIGLPILSKTTPPTSYADLNINAMITKFGAHIFQYFGLGETFTAATWQYVVIAIGLAGLVYWFIRRKNWLALWGMIWMLLALAISLPILYPSSRYNYLPLIGFWIMVIAFLSGEIRALKERFKIKPQLVSLVIGLVLLFHLGYQVAMLQWEIKDYRSHGEPYRTVVEMYRQVKDELPRDRPIIFVDISKRKAVHEAARTVQGYKKVLFVRERAIWQLVFISPLANFVGEPFKERMELIPDNQLDAVFKGNYTVLVFTDDGFFIPDRKDPRLEEYYQKHGKLPYKVQAVRFRNL